MRTVFILLLLIFSISIPAQKIVFSESYDPRNGPDNKFPSAKLMEDSVSGQKVLIVSGMRELAFFLFDPNWKLLKKFTKPLGGNSVLRESFFRVLKYSNSQDKWTFIGNSYANYNRETIDFAAQTHQVQANIIPDIAGVEEFFTDEGKNCCLYYTKDGLIKVYTL